MPENLNGTNNITENMLSSIATNEETPKQASGRVYLFLQLQLLFEGQQGGLQLDRLCRVTELRERLGQRNYVKQTKQSLDA